MYFGLTLITVCFAFCFYKMCTEEGDKYFMGCIGMLPILLWFIFVTISAYNKGTLEGPLVSVYSMLSSLWMNSITKWVASAFGAVVGFFTSTTVVNVLRCGCIGVILLSIGACVYGVCKGLHGD